MGFEPRFKMGVVAIPEYSRAYRQSFQKSLYLPETR
jgi:hypothetical protein